MLVGLEDHKPAKIFSPLTENLGFLVRGLKHYRTLYATGRVLHLKLECARQKLFHPQDPCDLTPSLPFSGNLLKCGCRLA